MEKNRQIADELQSALRARTAAAEAARDAQKAAQEAHAQARADMHKPAEEQQVWPGQPISILCEK